jgi:Zn-dependent protease with chaperone function
MDFFARQEQARKSSTALVAYFAMAVVLIVISVYVVLAAIFLRPRKNPLDDLGWMVNAEFGLWVVLGTIAVIGLGTLYKLLELARGGAVVATSLGGRLVQAQTTDPDERKLLNVVEEMAIASGVPVPDVYVLDREQGINAFAAGLKPGEAVVGVTRGCIRLLTRDELQGVIAHEFSHILNGDMRLNLRLIGWLNGILCLAMLGYYLLRIGFYSGGGGGGKKGGNPLPFIGLALVIIGFTGVFFGRLIKSAVSRQREFLADASAVQFTRNPDGIVGALKKIGGRVQGSRVMSPAAEEASHMFFGNGLKPPLFGSMLATHPPLVDRIKVWEPNFNGEFPPVAEPQAKPPPIRPPQAAGKAPFGVGGMLGGVTAAAVLGSAGAGGRSRRPRTGAPPGIDAASALQHAGSPTLEHLQHASEMLEDIPDNLRQAAQEPFAATALVCGVLLAPASESERDKLLATLPPPVVHEIQRLLPALTGLPNRLRLPLFELSLPALRQLSPRQFDDLEATIRRLIEADSEIDLFEYAVLKLLGRHLTPAFRPARRRTAMLYALHGVRKECAVLLSGLAHLGHADESEILAAYEAGLEKLQLSATENPLLNAAAANLPQIDAALDRLVQLALPLRRRVLDACAQAVAHDGRLEEREGELLRAIADTLECPLPPFLSVASGPEDEAGQA